MKELKNNEKPPPKQANNTTGRVLKSRLRMDKSFFKVLGDSFTENLVEIARKNHRSENLSRTLLIFLFWKIIGYIELHVTEAGMIHKQTSPIPLVIHKLLGLWSPSNIIFNPFLSFQNTILIGIIFSMIALLSTISALVLSLIGRERYRMQYCFLFFCKIFFYLFFFPILDMCFVVFTCYKEKLYFTGADTEVGHYACNPIQFSVFQGFAVGLIIWNLFMGLFLHRKMNLVIGSQHDNLAQYSFDFENYLTIGGVMLSAFRVFLPIQNRYLEELSNLLLAAIFSYSSYILFKYNSFKNPKLTSLAFLLTNLIIGKLFIKLSLFVFKVPNTQYDAITAILVIILSPIILKLSQALARGRFLEILVSKHPSHPLLIIRKAELILALLQANEACNQTSEITEGEIILLGLVKAHQNDCECLQCVCKEDYMNSYRLYENEKKIVLLIVRHLYEEGIKIFPCDMRLSIFFSYFLLEHESSIGHSVYLRYMLEEKDLNILAETYLWPRFLDYELKDKLQYSSSSAGTIVEAFSELDYVTILKYEELENTVKEVTKNSLELVVNFWQELSRNEVRMKILLDISKKISSYKENIDSIEKDLRSIQLKGTSKGTSKIGFLLAIFRYLICNDLTQGVKNFTSGLKDNVNHKKQYSFHEIPFIQKFERDRKNSVLIKMGLSPHNLGIITDASSSSLNIFGRERNYIIGKAVEVIMPSIFAEAHSTKIRAFMEGKSSFSSVSGHKNIFSITNKGFCFPVRINYNLVYSRAEGLVAVALIRKTLKMESNDINQVPVKFFILTDHLGNIDSMSKDLSENIEYSPQDKKNVLDLCNKLRMFYKPTTTFHRRESFPLNAFQRNFLNKRESSLEVDKEKETECEVFDVFKFNLSRQKSSANSLIKLAYKGSVEFFVNPEYITLYSGKKVVILSLTPKPQDTTKFTSKSSFIQQCSQSENLSEDIDKEDFTVDARVEKYFDYARQKAVQSQDNVSKSATDTDPFSFEFLPHNIIGEQENDRNLNLKSKGRLLRKVNVRANIAQSGGLQKLSQENDNEIPVDSSDSNEALEQISLPVEKNIPKTKQFNRSNLYAEDEEVNERRRKTPASKNTLTFGKSKDPFDNDSSSDETYDEGLIGISQAQEGILKDDVHYRLRRVEQMSFQFFETSSNMNQQLKNYLKIQNILKKAPLSFELKFFIFVIILFAVSYIAMILASNLTTTHVFEHMETYDQTIYHIDLAAYNLLQIQRSFVVVRGVVIDKMFPKQFNNDSNFDITRAKGLLANINGLSSNLQIYEKIINDIGIGIHSTKLLSTSILQRDIYERKSYSNYTLFAAIQVIKNSAYEIYRSANNLSSVNIYHFDILTDNLMNNIFLEIETLSKTLKKKLENLIFSDWDIIIGLFSANVGNVCFFALVFIIVFLKSNGHCERVSSIIVTIKPEQLEENISRLKNFKDLLFNDKLVKPIGSRQNLLKFPGQKRIKGLHKVPYFSGLNLNKWIFFFFIIIFFLFPFLTSIITQFFHCKEYFHMQVVQYNKILLISGDKNFQKTFLVMYIDILTTLSQTKIRNNDVEDEMSVSLDTIRDFQTYYKNFLSSDGVDSSFAYIQSDKMCDIVTSVFCLRVPGVYGRGYLETRGLKALYSKRALEIYAQNNRTKAVAKQILNSDLTINIYNIDVVETYALTWLLNQLREKYIQEMESEFHEFKGLMVITFVVFFVELLIFFAVILRIVIKKYREMIQLFTFVNYEYVKENKIMIRFFNSLAARK